MSQSESTADTQTHTYTDTNTIDDDVVVNELHPKLKNVQTVAFAVVVFDSFP